MPIARRHESFLLLTTHFAISYAPHADQRLEQLTGDVSGAAGAGRRHGDLAQGVNSLALC